MKRLLSACVALGVAFGSVGHVAGGVRGDGVNVARGQRFVRVQPAVPSPSLFVPGIKGVCNSCLMMNSSVINEVVHTPKYPNANSSACSVQFQSIIDQGFKEFRLSEGDFVARGIFPGENHKPSAFVGIGFGFPILTSLFPNGEYVFPGCLGSVEKSQGPNVGSRVMADVRETKSERETDPDPFDILKVPFSDQVGFDPRPLLITHDTQLSAGETQLSYRSTGVHNGRGSEGGSEKELYPSVCSKPSHWPGLAMIGVGGITIFVSGSLWVLGISRKSRVGSVATFLVGCAIVGHGSNLLLDAETAAASHSRIGTLSTLQSRFRRYQRYGCFST